MVTFQGICSCSAGKHIVRVSQHPKCWLVTRMYYILVPFNQKKLPKGSIFAYLEDPGLFTIYFCINEYHPGLHTYTIFLLGRVVKVHTKFQQVPGCTQNASTMPHWPCLKIAKKMVNPLVSCGKKQKNTCPNSTIKYNVTCSSSAPKNVLKGLPCLKRVSAYPSQSYFLRGPLTSYKWTHVTPLIGI